MSHVALVAFGGFRIREERMLELGMRLPGLRRRGKALAELPSLGLLTLAGMLPDHWSCSYHVTARWDDELVERIVAERPDLVAISALTASVNEAYAFGSRLRIEGLHVALGGLHATVCADEARRFCDTVVIGAGEQSWHELLRDIGQGSPKPLYRSRPAKYVDEWPIPRFDLLGPGRPARFTLQTQRGCPLACDFCGASRLLGTFREKPVANIAAELRAISALAPRPLIELADDNTFVGTRDASELCDVLDHAGARWFTESDWRIGERPELLARLAESGCVYVLVGIESLVFRYPGMGSKQAELERMMDAVHAIQDAGIVVNGCFIVGADGETRESIDRMARFILDGPLAEVQITLQTPFPGTPLRRRLSQQNRLLGDRDWSHHTLFDVTFRPDRLGVAELEQAFRELMARIYSEEATRRRNAIRREIWRRNPKLRQSDAEASP